MLSLRRFAALMILPLLMAAFACESSLVNAPSDGQILLSANPTTIVLDENSVPPVLFGVTLITAQIFDTNGVPQPNVSVLFGTDGGVLASAPPGQPTVALTTDKDGFVSDTLTLAIGDPDAVVVTLRSGTLSNSIGVAKFETPPNQPPFPFIDIVPGGSALLNETVIYDGTASADPDGDAITCYQWQIETSANIASPSLPCTPPNTRCEISQGAGTSILTRSYSVEQLIAVTLRVTDDPTIVCDPFGPVEPAAAFPGVTAELYEIVCDNSVPVAQGGANQTVALSGASTVDVALNGSASFDSESGIVSYDWTCGNGGASMSGVGVICTYASVGTFQATLTVINGCGQVAQDIVVVTVVP